MNFTALPFFYVLTDSKGSQVETRLHPTEQVRQYAVHSSLVTACFSVTAFDLKAFWLSLINVMGDTVYNLDNFINT